MAQIKGLSCLRFVPSPYGSDVLLLVDRGIPCEAHTEVFSAHVTNQPDEEDLQEVLNERAPYITTAYSSLLNIVKEMPFHYNERDWSFQNNMMGMFFKKLVSAIAIQAEDVACKKLDRAIEEGRVVNGQIIDK